MRQERRRSVRPGRPAALWTISHPSLELSVPLALVHLAAATLDSAGPSAAGAEWAGVVAHSRAVARLAARAGALLGLDGDEVAACGLLHDVGKAAVPGAVLAKAGRLSAREWRAVRAHSETGAAIVADVPGLAHLAPAVRAVHERWDGRGYPDGLAGRDIPRVARLVAACDAYVAMTEVRAYGHRLSHAEAVRELRAGAGAQFDPELACAAATAASGLGVPKPASRPRLAPASSSLHARPTSAPRSRPTPTPPTSPTRSFAAPAPPTSPLHFEPATAPTTSSLHSDAAATPPTFAAPARPAPAPAGADRIAAHVAGSAA